MNKQFLIDYYRENYHNLKKIKKYEEADDKLVSEAFDKLDDKYVPLIERLFKMHDFVFCIDRNEGCCHYGMNGNKVCNVISAKVTDGEGTTLFHELGHAYDSFNNHGNVNLFSPIAKDSKTNKSLTDVINEEIIAHKDEIFKTILTEYETLVNAELGEGYFKNYIECKKLLNKYAKYQRKLGGMYGIYIGESEKRLTVPILGKKKPNYDENKAIYDQIHEEVKNKDANAVKNAVESSKALKTIYAKYDTIIDALSSALDTNSVYGLEGHGKNYYKESSTHLASEFFANTFSALMTDDTVKLEGTKTLAPKSYDMFMTIFKTMGVYVYGLPKEMFD